MACSALKVSNSDLGRASGGTGAPPPPPPMIWTLPWMTSMRTLVVRCVAWWAEALPASAAEIRSRTACGTRPPIALSWLTDCLAASPAWYPARAVAEALATDASKFLTCASRLAWAARTSSSAALAARASPSRVPNSVSKRLMSALTISALARHTPESRLVASTLAQSVA